MKQALIVTGATSGIGLASVRKFLEVEDLYIIAVGRDISKITIDSDRLKKVVCDVSDFRAVRALIDNIKNHYRIVGLINAAGVASVGDFLPECHDGHQYMIDVNISGLTSCIEAVLPIMRENKIGTIINLSSLADRYPRPNNAVYAATKSYVKSLSDSLRLQNAKYNIRVINVAPALIATPMVTDVLGIKEGVIDVDQFAKIMKFLYEQPQDICIRDIVVAPTWYEG